MTIRYGWDQQGGFIALNDAERHGAYAYPTSTFANRAKRNPVKVATDMLTGGRLPCATEIEDEMYERLAAKLGRPSCPN